VSVIGRTSRIIPQGVKLDECASCRALAAHAIARRVRWFHAFSLQLVRLGSDHVLVCGQCGHETQLADDVASRAIREGSLQVDRDRAVVDSAVATRTSAGVANGLPPISLQRLDPTVVRANLEHRLKEVVPVRAQGRQALYDRAWPAIAAVLGLAVLGGGGFLAIQATGITAAGPQASPIAARASTVPTSSPSPRPTPKPTQPPFELDFNWWKQAYIDHVQPCYTGGACDLDWLIQYSDGTSKPLAAEAVRQSELYRDYDSVQIGSVSDCRQEHGSSFTLQASIASEIEVIQALKPGEAMPSWRPALAVEFEPCSSPLPDFQKGASTLRDSLADARSQLVKIQKLVRAKNWAGARDASAPLAALAATIMRTAATDFPPTDGSTWAPIRGAGWDLMRVSGLIQVKRLAGAKSTSSLIDATLKSIDKIKLPQP
jgi:hypothetical protein